MNLEQLQAMNPNRQVTIKVGELLQLVKQPAPELTTTEGESVDSDRDTEETRTAEGQPE